MNQPIPHVRAEDIERLVARDFRPEDVAAARAVLAQYGMKDWHREHMRVRAAALKMAAGSVERLQQAITQADRDYRDVLAYAEYPSYTKTISPSERDDSKRQSALSDDCDQYRAWFERTH